MNKIKFKDSDYSKHQNEINDIRKLFKRLMKNPIFRIKLFLFKKKVANNE